MTILVVSHSSIVDVYRGKLRELAGYPNIQVHLIIPHTWPENNQSIVAVANESPPYTTHVIRAYRPGLIASYFYHPVVFQRLVRNIRPDVVYAEEEPWSVAAWQCLRIAQKLKARFVFFTWENIQRQYKWISEKILRYVLAHADAAVAGTKAAESILRQRRFRKAISVIPQYGVDLTMVQYSSAPPEIVSLPRPVVAYVGRLEKEKGVHLLLEAWRNMTGKCSLVFIGNGAAKSPLVNEIRSASSKNIPLVIDSIPHAEVPRYLQAIDILVLPSITTSQWKEQFGRVLIEAMASGVAVVGSDSGAIPGIIGDAGLVVQEGNVKSLSDTLDKVVASPELINSLRAKGRLRAATLYSNDGLAKSLLSFFDRVRELK